MPEANLWAARRAHARAVRNEYTAITERSVAEIVDPDDNLIVDTVGAWAREKHERLQKYIDAARAARAKFLPPRGTGGAAYIELFSGSGRSFVEDKNKFIDGSPIVAFKSARQSGKGFSELHFNDRDRRKAEALRQRIAKLGGSAKCYNKEATEAVDIITQALNPTGLHFAFLDPYNLRDLPFSIIERLARLQRIDMLIHFSIQDLQRNLRRYLQEDSAVLDAFMPGWRENVDVDTADQGVIRARLLDHWLNLIRGLNTETAEGKELVSGSEGQRLYWLIFVSRNDLGLKLWEAIRNLDGQREFDF